MAANSKILLLGLMLLACRLTGQSPVLDSFLRQTQNAPTDSLRWLAWFKLSNFQAKTNLDSALLFSNKALEFAQKRLPGTRCVPNSLNLIGGQWAGKGSFEQAAAYFEQALEAGQKIKCRPCQIISLGNIGNVFLAKKDYEKAENYYNQALAQHRELRDTMGMVRMLNNLGILHRQSRNNDKAEVYFTEALALIDRQHSDFARDYILNNLGSMYEDRGDYEKALECYGQNIALAQKNGDQQALFLGTFNTGFANLHLKNYAAAAEYLKKAEQIALKLNTLDKLSEVYDAQTDLFKAEGDYQNAFISLQKFHTVKDSITAQLNGRVVAEVDVKYQSQQKEAEIAKKQLQIQRQRLLLFGALAALLALIGLFQYFRNRQRLRQTESEHALALEHAAAEKLRELDRVKSSFFANISHEFRTPLTLISGPVKKWMGGTASTEVVVPTRELKVLGRNAERLLELVNQLLDLSKLESGRMKLLVAKNDLSQVLRVLAHSFESMAEHNGIQYIIEISAEPAMAWFDRDKLEKIVSNLLSNAFKYTPPHGSVRLTARLENRWLDCTVEDSGPGIQTADIDKIFDRFYQVEGSEDKGTGIGLALVKELVALHRGQIEVQSTPGKGSAFLLHIPVGWEAFYAEEITEVTASSSAAAEARSAQEGPTEARSAQEEPAFTLRASAADARPLCLVVEDNRDVQEFIREQLEGPFRVILAKNGVDGLELATQQIPDLIVSDVMMPKMDGTELCSRLKTDERTSHIPVILLTAKADQASKIEGLETGADDYLTKPFDAQELLVRAQNLINQRLRLRERFSRDLYLKPKDIALTSADERFLQRMMEAMEANLSNEQFSVEELASVAGMSRSQLHRKLTALTDQPPVEFIRFIRLRRAKEMLEAGTGNVSEICYEVGFNSPAYFAKVFKDTFGLTPSEVRANV